jgi:hypothetical protein
MNKNKKLFRLHNNVFFAVFFCFFLFFSVFLSKSQTFFKFSLENSQNHAFQAGEKLKYKISYGKSNKKRGQILAGYATFTVEENESGDYILKAFGQSTKLFSLFMKVRHTYESIVDRNTINTLRFKMDLQEGKYFDTDSISFQKNITNKHNTNDILSVLYRLRSINELIMLENDTLFFSYYYRKSYFESYVINNGTEMINTKFGRIQAIKWSPLLEKGRVFRDTTGAFIWTSANSMRIPLKLEIPILVGSIYVNLVSTKGTVYDFK